jgi:hypothetical protein
VISQDAHRWTGDTITAAMLNSVVVSHNQLKLEQQKLELVKQTHDMQEMITQLQNKSVFDGVATASIYDRMYEIAASFFAPALKSANSSNDVTVPSRAPLANFEEEAELSPESSSSSYDPILLLLPVVSQQKLEQQKDELVEQMHNMQEMIQQLKNNISSSFSSCHRAQL